ncbi:YcfA family protein [Catenulispora acidiphila DSM 44928]|uniref:YcfA family protein n=1 Tax=Catenulispora acidiphila (strain DSM 44928 / JCM 14897 / NBRC 102108 / NRRL B-24433 / ID139908) TaxID=479433 RepID=C7QHG7_CATAD|nr:type II toxin-antitoxin system HicA family toxin [Catenulispora acidiphila]ACU69106.1 YcfA family protein [Catenulispora acidiphila DSM 44928]
MKRRDLLKALSDIAAEASVDFELVRHGGSHDIYRVGALHLTIPRHTEISELLAKKILKEASQ